MDRGKGTGVRRVWGRADEARRGQGRPLSIAPPPLSPSAEGLTVRGWPSRVGPSLCCVCTGTWGGGGLDEWSASSIDGASALEGVFSASPPGPERMASLGGCGCKERGSGAVAA